MSYFFSSLQLMYRQRLVLLPYGPQLKKQRAAVFQMLNARGELSVLPNSLFRWLILLIQSSADTNTFKSVAG